MDDVTCMACGCLCDDIGVEPDGAIRKACEHGTRWIKDNSAYQPPAPSLLNGQPAQLDIAIAAAAKLLANARYPLVFGLAELCVDGQRAMVALADEIGACVDMGGEAEDATMFFPGIGSAGCTWGEVIHRADLIVYWNCDLNNNWWRHQERVIDRARQERHVEILTIDGDIESVWLMRALVQGKKVGATDQLRQLAEQLRQAKYVAFIHHGDSRLAVALQALAHDVNLVTRCRMIDLGGPGNAAGQSQVIRWQTGYSRAVGLHRGYPVSYGREFAAETILQCGEADAVVSVGSASDHLSPTAKQQLSRVPHVMIVPGQLLTSASPQIALFTSIPGINARGITFRSDGMTLRVRAPFSSSLPASPLVIRRLTEEFRQVR